MLLVFTASFLFFVNFMEDNAGHMRSEYSRRKIYVCMHVFIYTGIGGICGWNFYNAHKRLTTFIRPKVWAIQREYLLNFFIDQWKW